MQLTFDGISGEQGQIFKSIYFPPDRVRSGVAKRVTISLSITPLHDAVTNQAVALAKEFSSKQFRAALGNPYLEDLEAEALLQNRSFSNLCLHLILKCLRDTCIQPDQSNLPLGGKAGYSGAKAPLGVTFRENLGGGIHGWYPYVEGFSGSYVRDLVLGMKKRPRTIYDPFGGAGTVPVAGSQLGIPTFYSEINPFMAFVARTKLEAAPWALRNLKLFCRIAQQYCDELESNSFKEQAGAIDLTLYRSAFPDRDFFEEPHIRELLAAKHLAGSVSGPHDYALNLLHLACSANAVGCSNMTRRADLRRRRPGEYKDRVVNVAQSIKSSVRRIIDDLEGMTAISAPSLQVSDDCRNTPVTYDGAFDLVLTSPPYLNGTNYFRNTKIELWFMELINDERDLSTFTRKALASGINNVNRTKVIEHANEDVEVVSKRLDECAEDDRIPLLVRSYFSDMANVCERMSSLLTETGRFIVDIGDSKFYGVHVPTDQLLIKVAEEHGLRLQSSRVLARRHSRDKSPLVQVELTFQKAQPSARSKHKSNPTSLAEKIQVFGAHLPYKSEPFSSRSWGHGLHSLCSYQGKLKPAIAHWLINTFTDAGACVLDPLGGVGTVALEAALQGRRGITNDKSPLASVVAQGKVCPLTLSEALQRWAELCREMNAVTLDSEDLESAKFGLNGTVADYYHEDTLREILKARKLFVGRAISHPREAFLWANLLHVLHGNRPYALSRLSHPITPFHPTGAFTYKSVERKVVERLTRTLSKPMPATFAEGESFYGDFRNLPSQIGKVVDTIITSPPFPGMRFDRPNWLRLWFCGWIARDFHETSKQFIEREQTKSLDCYLDLFTACHTMLKQSGLLILHLGGSKSTFVEDVITKAKERFACRDVIRENVQAIEQHGIRDRGRTSEHCLVFLEPR